jgi:putative ubiquitin-RnfH superfamily antitoxin RatB of RatAB toxin-antitoxin module
MAEPGPAETIGVEVVYALPERQWRVPLRLPAGSTVADAVAGSGLRDAIAGLVVDDALVGIFARPATLATRLSDGDRVELYRPLLCDPKDVRRQRAQAHPRGKPRP